MILTDDEIWQIGMQDISLDAPYGYARAIESAVIEKLKAQEPSCWTNDTELSYSQFKRPDGELTSGSFWAEYHEDCDIPLYEHPLPPDDVVRDAKRYRWLRSENWFATGIVHEAPYGRTAHDSWEHLDAAIDAKMKEMK